MSRDGAVSDSSGVDDRIVVVQPRDRVLVDGGGIGRFIRCRAGNSYRFGIPSVERIGILRGRRLCRIGMGRDGAVSDSSGIDDGIVVVQPCDGVLVDGGVEQRGVGRVAGDGCDRGRPSGKGVGVLCVSFLCRVGVSRSCTVFVIFCCGYTVNIPCDGISRDIRRVKHAFMPIGMTVAVRAEVDIVGTCGSDNVICVFAARIPCIITAVCLKRVVCAQRRSNLILFQSVVVPDRSEGRRVVSRPSRFGHGANQIVGRRGIAGDTVVIIPNRPARAVLDAGGDIIGLLRIRLSAIGKDDTLGGYGDRGGVDESVRVRRHLRARPCVVAAAQPVVNIDVIPADKVDGGDIKGIDVGFGKLRGVGRVAGHRNDSG